MADQPWYVYMVRCCDNSLYAGIATDLERRLAEHNSPLGNKGAKYTRSRQPVDLVYFEKLNNRSAACQRESVLKRLNKLQKEKLITKQTATAV